MAFLLMSFSQLQKVAQKSGLGRCCLTLQASRGRLSTASLLGLRSHSSLHFFFLLPRGGPPVNPHLLLPSPQPAGHGDGCALPHAFSMGLFFFLNLGDRIKGSFPCHYVLPLFNNERGLFSGFKMKTKAIYICKRFITNRISNPIYIFQSNDKR